MFKNLTNFGYQRSTKEAFGFYLAYLLLFSIASAVIGGTLGVAGVGPQNNSFYDGFDWGRRAGTVFSVIASSGVSFWILKEKGLLGNFWFILPALLAGLIAVFIGGLGGLIPVAYLTTRPKSTSFIMKDNQSHSRTSTMSENENPTTDTTSEDSGTPVQTGKTNGLAITSIILGIVSIVPVFMFPCFPISLLSGIGALITGFIALGQIKRSEDRQKGRGIALALAGIIWGGVVFYFLPV